MFHVSVNVHQIISSDFTSQLASRITIMLMSPDGANINLNPRREREGEVKPENNLHVTLFSEVQCFDGVRERLLAHVYISLEVKINSLRNRKRSVPLNAVWLFLFPTRT